MSQFHFGKLAGELRVFRSQGLADSRPSAEIMGRVGFGFCFPPLSSDD